MKTFIANETLLLIDGEIYTVSKEYPSKNDYVIDGYGNIGVFKGHEEKREWLLVEYKKGLCSEDLKNISKIIASTKQLPNVKQLPREVFVNGVDVKKIAKDLTDSKYCMHNDPNEYGVFKEGIITGYNANKNEFTKDEMYQCALQFFYYWYNVKGSNTAQGLQEWLPTFINSLRPLTLPQSITTNDELEIISVSWK